MRERERERELARVRMGEKEKRVDASYAKRFSRIDYGYRNIVNVYFIITGI